MEEVINTILAYNNSPKIIQRKDAFNFSIDSTILSFFVDIKKKVDKILDLGSGNGAIPLFLSLRTTKPIIGIEIQKDLVDMANRSIAINHLESQIKVMEGDIKGISKQLGLSSFNLIVSNPPFFKIETSPSLNESEYESIARHEIKITMGDIIKEASLLLKDNGSLVMIQSTDRFLETLDLLKENNLIIKRLRFVYPRDKKDSYVFMFEAVKNGKSHGLKVMEPLYIFDKDDYSKEVLSYFHYHEVPL